MMIDHGNPILVKELRQAARSRTLIVLVALTLLACGLMTLRALGEHGAGGYEPSGKALFRMLFFCQSLVGFLVVPFIAHRSLAREQEDGAWELLQLTGLGPRRILLGKLASTVVVGGIFSAVLAPFFLLSAGLGGVEVRALLRLALYGTAVTGALSIGTLFAAALPVTRAQRTGVQLVVLVGLVIALGFAFRVVEQLVTEDSADWLFFVGQAGQSFALLAGELAVAALCVVLFEAAVARLSLPTERYARGPRVAVGLVTAGITAIGLYRWVVTHDTAVIAIASSMTALLGFAAALGFAADQDRPRGRGAKGPAMLRPGAVSGLRYTAVLLALPTALWLGVAYSAGGEHAAAVIGAPSYVLIYIALALLICRHPRRLEKLASPDIVRGVAILLVLFGSILPVALTTVSDASVWAWLPNPLLGTGNLQGVMTDQRSRAAAVLFVTALVLTTLADRVLVARARRAGAAS